MDSEFRCCEQLLELIFMCQRKAIFIIHDRLRYDCAKDSKEKLLRKRVTSSMSFFFRQIERKSKADAALPWQFDFPFLFYMQNTFCRGLARSFLILFSLASSSSSTSCSPGIRRANKPESVAR